MARKDLIAGNWKMNATHLEAIQMVQKLSYRLDYADYDRVDVVVCPPFTALRSVQTVIEADHLGYQARCPGRALAGEWRLHRPRSHPAMLAKLGVRFVIVGHSERREIFGESDDIVNRKVKAVLDAEMIPIMCLGETLDEREDGQTEAKVGSQLTASLSGLTASQVAGMVIAYEPIWAIGTGRTARARTTPPPRSGICARWCAPSGRVQRMTYESSTEDR